MRDEGYSSHFSAFCLSVQMTFQNLRHLQFGNRHQTVARCALLALNLPFFENRPDSEEKSWPVKLLLSMGTTTYRKHE